MNWALLTQLPPAAGMTGGGLGNAVVGTLVLVGLATAIATPIGIGAALFSHELGSPDRPLARLVRWASAMLSGVPSIVVGAFGYATVVVTTARWTGGRYAFSAIAGALALAVIMVPAIAQATESRLRLIPTAWREGAAALGATPQQTLLRVVLPAGAPAMVTGVLLAMARAAGETAPLLFTALGLDFWLRDLRRPAPSLSISIWRLATGIDPNQQELAWAGALLLLCLVFGVALLARWGTRRFD
ncbi:MAG: phosphate ABC transporter permease PstA [Oscillatoriales cyanobacterium SM2_1_8]|nr:phosphate ABC transporter permease PstA [Oscillatoriales cyanobacterium SM2_1_8]